MRTTGAAGSSSNHGQIAHFTSVLAPVLRLVDPIQVAKFVKKREIYELEIKSKQPEVTALRMTPYRDSIDRSLIWHLVFMCYVDDIPEATVDSLTIEHVKEYLI